MLMNTIQILVNVPLLSVALPSNALFTFQALVAISKMNLFPKDQVDSFLSHLGISTAGNSGSMTSNFQTMDIF